MTAAAWPDPPLYGLPIPGDPGWTEAPAPARTASLDTGEQIDNGAPDRAQRDTDRAIRNDRSKVTLAELLAAAARARFHAGETGDGEILDAMARGLDGCRGGSAFRDAGCGAFLVRPRSCDVRLCPDCERSRSARLVGRLDELVDAMDRAVFWTLTIPNVARGDLEPAIGVLLAAFRALRRRAIFAGGSCKRPDCRHRPVAGGVYGVEVTWRPESRTWHPHLHALMDAPYIVWSELRDDWRAVTCDEIRRAERKADGLAGRVPRCAHPTDERGVAVAPCRGASVVWVEGVAGEPGSPERRAAIRETLKYTAKGLLRPDGSVDPTAGPDEIAELLLAVRRRRLVAGWGTFRNVHDRDDDPLDPELYLVGPDVLPALRGLPRACPACKAEALWELPIVVPRIACRQGADGSLTWRPPPGGRRYT